MTARLDGLAILAAAVRDGKSRHLDRRGNVDSPSLIGGDKLALPFHARTGQSEDKPSKKAPAPAGAFHIFGFRREPSPEPASSLWLRSRGVDFSALARCLRPVQV
jgi:hypothetical protein